MESCNTRDKRKKKKRTQSETQDLVEKVPTHNSLAMHERRKRKESLPLENETDLGSPVEWLDSSDLERHYSTVNPAGRKKKQKKTKQFFEGGDSQ